MNLRKYQETSIDDIQRIFRERKRKVLLHLATGGGKTLIFCTICQRTAKNGKRVLIVVKGKNLVHQAVKRLKELGLDPGIYQGNKTQDTNNKILVASIDTLGARKIAPEADLLIIDEAHLTQGKRYAWLIGHYKNSFMLSVTATPHLKGGMRHLAGDVVYPISLKELIDQGYLSKPKYYVPTKLDLSSVRVRKGEYDAEDLERVAKEANVFGDVISTYKSLAPGKPAICFCISIAHSKQMLSAFSEAGISAMHLDADSPDDYRDEVIAKLKSKEISVITNVNILSTGVDIPEIEVIISCRPTKSYNLWIQQVGRGTRITETKKEFFVLDHANNTEEHGMIEEEPKCDLDGIPKIKKPAVKVCAACFACYEKAKFSACPACGYEDPEEERKEAQRLAIEAKNFELKLLEEKKWNDELNNLVTYAKEKKFKKGWVFHTMKSRFGEEIADKAWAKVKGIKKWPKPENDHKKRADDIFHGRAPWPDWMELPPLVYADSEGGAPFPDNDEDKIRILKTQIDFYEEHTEQGYIYNPRAKIIDMGNGINFFELRDVEKEWRTKDQIAKDTKP